VVLPEKRVHEANLRIRLAAGCSRSLFLRWFNRRSLRSAKPQAERRTDLAKIPHFTFPTTIGNRHCNKSPLSYFTARPMR
jgi:hypothetical protein